MKNIILLISIFIAFNLEAQPFFRIKLHGKWGAIDSTGKIVIKPVFTEQSITVGENNQYFIGRFKDTMVVFNSKLKSDTFINFDDIGYLDHDLFYFTLDSNLIKKYKWEKNKKIATNIDRYQFRINKLDFNYNKFRTGIIDFNCNLKITPIFVDIGQFKSGVARVQFTPGDVDNGKCGMIDTLGNWVVPPIYKSGELYECKEGLIIFRNNGLFGVIDKTGKVIINPKYTLLIVCKYGYLIYSTNEDPKCAGLMTKDEKIIISDKGRHWIDFDPQCPADTLVTLSKIHGYSRYNYQIWSSIVRILGGREIFRSNELRIGAEEWGTFLIYYPDDNRGLMNIRGEKLLMTEYFTIDINSYPLMKVSGQNGVGFMDHNGKIVIPCQYNGADPFKNGLAAVYTGKYSYGFVENYPQSKMGYINMKGKLVWPPTN